MVTEPIVDSFKRQMRASTDRFYSETAAARFEYEYADRFFSDSGPTTILREAQQSREELIILYQRQQHLLAQLDEYDGDDWDALYGRTGLWRRLYDDSLHTRWLVAQLDFWRAMASQKPQRDSLVADLLRQTDSNQPPFVGPMNSVLKARLLSVLNPADASINKRALDLLAPLIIQPSESVPDTVRLAAAILYYRLLGRIDPADLQSLAELCRKGDCANNLELRISAAILELRLADSSSVILADLVRPWPSVRGLFGRIILNEIEDRKKTGRFSQNYLQKKTLLEIRLVSEIILSTNPSEHLDVMNAILQTESFAVPQILYTSALANQPSNPSRSLELLSRCLALQRFQSDENLQCDPSRIAYDAALLAARLFASQPDMAAIAEKIISEYCSLAGEQTDPAIRYAWVSMLRACGNDRQADRILDEIIRSPGPWRNPARLDRIISGISVDPNSPDLRRTAETDLARLIRDIPAEAPGRDQTVRADSVGLYCRLLLLDATAESARKVLTLLEQTQGLEPSKKSSMASCALRILERPFEAIAILAATPPDCNDLGETLATLSAVVDRIDECSTDSHRGTILKNSLAVATLCAACANSEIRPDAMLIQAELLAVSAESGQLDQARAILDSPAVRKHSDSLDGIRCRARLHEARQEYAEAVTLWSRMAESVRPDTTEQPPSFAWWQARYHTIRCWAALPKTTPEEVKHTIEILFHGQYPPPKPWDEMFRALPL